MTFDTHSPFGYSTVKTIVSQSLTTLIITVKSGHGQRFAVQQQIVICPATSQPTFENAMIARITGISGDQLTIDVSSGVREGSNTRTVKFGDQIANVITPKALTDIEAATNADLINTALAFSIAL